MTNSIKTQKTKSTRNGIYIGDTGAAVAEMAAQAGFDYLRLDSEHSFRSPHEMRELIRIADAYSIPVLVRTPSLIDMTRLLDFGATGILVPDVRTARDAEQAVSACKYAPIGTRGVSRVTRCTGYGAMRGTEYHTFAAESTCVGVQIESQEGLNNLEEILSVPGVDLVTTGPEDMAQSMGIWGQTKHPNILEAQDRVLYLGHKHGKLVMLSAGTRERYLELKQKGTDLITIAFDSELIMDAMRNRIKEFSCSKE